MTRSSRFSKPQRCLNCDVQTVFTGQLCIECDACVDICPMDCITFTENGTEAGPTRTADGSGTQPRARSLYRHSLKTGRIMVKDEDVCLHCGLCAERCPTGAWDMQQIPLDPTQAGRHAAAADDRHPREAGEPVAMPDIALGAPALRGTNETSRNDRLLQALSRWKQNRNPQSPRSAQRFCCQIRQRERLGVGERQPIVRQVDPAHGRPGELAEYLPVEHPGSSDLVRGADQQERPSRTARRRRPDGRDEPGDLGRGCRRDRARRLPVLRFDQAAAAARSSATTSTSSAPR